MTGWYSIIPAGTIAIGNLTPVGQNSGQVGCRWPPNGHHLAACLKLPTPEQDPQKRKCQLWGPFWYNEIDIYVTLPLPVYAVGELKPNDIPTSIYRMQWRDGRWQVRTEDEKEKIEIIGGRFLIGGNSLQVLWEKEYLTRVELERFPWETLTLSHNSREDFQVKDEGGFFAEKTTWMKQGWSILVKIIGDYEPPPYGILGAGSTPVAIKPVKYLNDDWLQGACADGNYSEGLEITNSTGAVLLTGALWQNENRQESVPYPPLSTKAYAADVGIPWQTWKRVRHRDEKNNPKAEKRVQALTPGEWMTPAGAVYLWDKVPPVKVSAPLPNYYNPNDNRYILGYGHLWLFKDKE